MSDNIDIELQKKLLDQEEDVDESFSNGIKGGDRVMISKINRSKKASGCRKAAGCLAKTACILLAILTVLLIVVSFCVYRFTGDVVRHMTVTDSKTFPVVRMSDAEVDFVASRVKVFVDELRINRVPERDLVLTQDEINGLLGHSDYLRGNMYVTLTEGKILEEYSLPVDMLPGGKGRYFLGHDYTEIDSKAQRVELKMETAAKHEDWFVGPLYFLQLHFDGKDFPEYHQHLLELFIENGSFFGNPIPDDFIDQKLNLLEGAYADEDSGEDIRAVINGIESVSVHNGQIVITPRRAEEPIVVVEEHDPVPDDMPENQESAYEYLEDDDYEEIEEIDEMEFEDEAQASDEEEQFEEGEEDPDNSAGSIMLRATKIEPARPKQVVTTVNLRAIQSDP